MLVPECNFFLNRAALAQRWALNQESTLIGGEKGQIVWNGRFFCPFFSLGGEVGQTIILIAVSDYLFRESWMTTSPMVLIFRSSKSNTTNVSNIARFLSLL